MGLPASPVSLPPEQVEALNRALSTMRHDINNHLSLVVAAAELIRFKPNEAERMIKTLNEQPAKITNCISQFTADFERALSITHD